MFADAGYRVHKGYDDGVLMVDFPILPTDTSVGVMERREHRAESRSIRRLLTPGRMVLLGPGARVQELVVATLSGGFRGEVIAVSTDDVEVSGVRSAPSIAAVEGAIDLAVVSVPTAQLGGVVIDAAHKGAHGLVVLTGGADGAHDNRTVVNLARAYGVRAVGPDALGLINTDYEVGLNASPAPMPRQGVVGLFCQSAAIGVSLLNYARKQDLGLSSFLSTGDFADVTGNDVMQYWEDDDRHRGVPAVAGLDRQPAQVLPDRAPPGPAQAGGGLLSGAGRSGRPLRRPRWSGTCRGSGGRRTVPAERRDRDAPEAGDDRRRRRPGPAAAARKARACS